MQLNFARNIIPYVGSLIPFKFVLSFNDKIIGEINQKVKVIGDIWEMNCLEVPEKVDRRVLVSCILLMGLVERKMKQ